MSRFHRKTAPKVRDGRVRNKNNWAPSHSGYRYPPRLVVERQRPGPGHRHVLLKRDIERFVALIPGWEKLSVGLNAVVLADGRYTCDGWYNRGVIGLPAWPKNLCYEVNADWFRDHRDFLRRIGATVYGDDPETAEIHWTPDTARAYQLCHVFLHELGHHADRMHTRTKTDNGPRGEPFAEDYAFDLEARVLDRYFAEFGLPD